MVDLIDSDIRGGKQETFTIGLNYYASANVRFMLNLIFADVTDSGALVGGAPVGDDSPRILIGRVQFHF